MHYHVLWFCMIYALIIIYYCWLACFLSRMYDFLLRKVMWMDMFVAWCVAHSIFEYNYSMMHILLQLVFRRRGQWIYVPLYSNRIMNRDSRHWLITAMHYICPGAMLTMAKVESKIPVKITAHNTFLVLEYVSNKHWYIGILGIILIKKISFKQNKSSQGFQKDYWYHCFTLCVVI